jgi:hypothetical protein
MARDYNQAGVDGLILTYEDTLPDAFMKTRDVVQALVES